MSGEDQDDDKQHEPTQRRLDDARARGEVVRSTELAAAAGYGGLVLALGVLGGRIAGRIGGIGQTFLALPERVAPDFGAAEAGRLIGTVSLAVLPLLVLPGIAVLATLVAQRAVTVAPEKLLPRLSRLSPVANAGHRFGRNGLFEFAKSLVKLIVVGALLAAFLMRHMAEMVAALWLSPEGAMAVLGHEAIAFLALVAAISLALGALDYLWQRADFLRRNRMSRRELLDEMKESEGDPQMKQQRRRRGTSIAMNRMLADVPQANVVIVNPDHYAVALRWQRGSRRAPVCVAKGVDEVAARIRALAAEAGVPLRADPPTARLLHAEVEVGAEIQPAHYRAVAAAIRFAETMRTRARRSWR